MLRRCSLPLAVLVVAVLSACVSAESGPRVSKDKKLIGFAPDLVDASYLLDQDKQRRRGPGHDEYHRFHRDDRSQG